jgi:hypothetical protein
MTGKAELQKKVAQEHGMSFISVLRYYAEAGYGKDTTAKIIGYTPSNFRKLLKRNNDFDITWPSLKEQFLLGALDNGGTDAYLKRAASIKEYHRIRRLKGIPHPNGKNT